MENEKKYCIIGEVLICGICGTPYIDNSNDDNLVCENCIAEYFDGEKETK